MANKLQFVSTLADQTARDVTRSVENWKRYLDTSSPPIEEIEVAMEQAKWHNILG